MGLKEIAIDLLNGKLPIAAEQDLAAVRLVICKTCPEFSTMSRQCKRCGCFVDLKVKVLTEACPLNFW